MLVGRQPAKTPGWARVARGWQFCPSDVASIASISGGAGARLKRLVSFGRDDEEERAAVGDQLVVDAAGERAVEVARRHLDAAGAHVAFEDETLFEAEVPVRTDARARLHPNERRDRRALAVCEEKLEADAGVCGRAPLALASAHDEEVARAARLRRGDVRPVAARLTARLAARRRQRFLSLCRVAWPL